MLLTEKTYKQRTYLDPIHGPIELRLDNEIENLLAKLIDSKEFQRLRRIKQMGTGWFTFHGAEHTRFGHSIGSLYIAIKMLNHLSKRYSELNNYRLQIFTAALLHDIGHGPLSHTSEKLIDMPHEIWSKKIIQENTEINSLLNEFDPKLPNLLTDVLEYKNLPPYVCQIISSYVDCDRLDYLHRDSYYVGVPYGLTGSERIIASLEINSADKKLVVNENIGLDAVIHYLQARHSMYQQVYQHKKNLACDFHLRMIVERMREINPKDLPKTFKEWLNIKDSQLQTMSVNSYVQVDDYLLISVIQHYTYESLSEKILSDLCSRFLHRKLFKCLEFRQEVSSDKIYEILNKVKLSSKLKGLNQDYYAGIEMSASKPYEPYNAEDKKTSKAIFIKQKGRTIKELSEISGLIKALSQENVIKTCLVFAPELEDEIKNTKGFQELFK